MKSVKQNNFIFLLGVCFAIIIFVPFVKVFADIDVTATVPAICGNGAEEGAEACDDGNLANGDGCSSLCAVEGGDGGGNGGGGGGAGDPPEDPPAPVCGDGVQNGNDECDDGNQNNNDLCSNTCKIPVCGDGNVQGAEQCDDANAVNGDGCSQVCVLEPAAVCGDGVRQAAEQCDDGNGVNGDGCSAQCLHDPAPVCGNGVQEANEGCDDGNVLNGDGCSQVCQPQQIPRCGNRLLEFGEQCDDGNLASGDECSIACQLEPPPLCGNGRRERNEECDDGNVVNGDGCSNQCKFVPLLGTVCGNGVKEAGEQCDDGNRVNNDGCSQACQADNGVPVVPNGANPPADGAGGDPAADPQNPDNQNDPANPDQPQNGNNGQGDNAGGDPAADPQNPQNGRGNVLPVPILAGVDADAPFLENAVQVAKNIGKNFVAFGKKIAEVGTDIPTLKRNFIAASKSIVEETKILGKKIDRVANNPQVEEATKTVVAPATAAVVAATVVPSLASVVIPLLRFVFLQPLLLFGRKKRKEWGQLYNTLTKLPVDLAMVRLVDAKTKKILQSRVTDAQGRYLFIVEPGEYMLQVTKPGFLFPSTLLQEVQTDGKLLDIYHGELVRVTTSGIGITPNIPLDPIGAVQTPKRIVWERRWRLVQHAISVSGVVLTLVALYIAPVWYMWIFLGVHIVAYVGFNRFVRPKKPNGWGLVYEKTSAVPLGSAVVRLFTKQYNKLVSTQVTDTKGRYAFLVGSSDYYVTYEKKGYKSGTSESVHIAENETNSVIKEKIGLEKEV